jgi:hypothetical protein
MALDVRIDFADAYDAHVDYPVNLIFNTTYHRNLRNYKTSFLSNNRLCVKKDKLVDVGFRDFIRAASPGTRK